MSKPREENPELARVLSRVNALMKHEETSSDGAAGALPAEPEVPVLTEIYEGEPLTFAPRSPEALGIPASMADEAAAAEEAGIEAILAELMPLIQAEVKKAVRQELVNTEKIVKHRLETEFIQTLLEKLRSGSA